MKNDYTFKFNENTNLLVPKGGFSKMYCSLYFIDHQELFLGSIYINIIVVEILLLFSHIFLTKKKYSIVIIFSYGNNACYCKNPVSLFNVFSYTHNS